MCTCNGNGSGGSETMEWLDARYADDHEDDRPRWRLFGDPEKNRNTVDDVLAGVSAGLLNREARRGGGASSADSGSGGGMSTVLLIGGGIAAGFILSRVL